LRYKSAPFVLPHGDHSYSYSHSGLAITEVLSANKTDIKAVVPNSIACAKLERPYTNDKLFRNHLYHALDESISLYLQDHRGILVTQDNDRRMPLVPSTMEVVTGCPAIPVEYAIKLGYEDIARLPTNYIYRRHLKKNSKLEQDFLALEEIAITLLGFKELNADELDKIGEETFYLFTGGKEII